MNFMKEVILIRIEDNLFSKNDCFNLNFTSIITEAVLPLARYNSSGVYRFLWAFRSLYGQQLV